MTKSRKKRGGNTSKDIPVSTCDKDGATCPKITPSGASLMAISAHGVNQTKQQNAHQTAKIAALGQGGGSRKRRKKKRWWRCYLSSTRSWLWRKYFSGCF